MSRRAFAVPALIACFAGGVGLTAALAADPANGKVDPQTTNVTWKGTASGVVADPAVAPTPTTCAPPTCDRFTLDVAVGPAPLAGSALAVAIKTSPANAPANDNDLFLYDPAGKLQGMSTSAGGDESVQASDPVSGPWSVVVAGATGGGDYAGTATLMLPAPATATTTTSTTTAPAATAPATPPATTNAAPPPAAPAPAPPPPPTNPSTTAPTPAPRSRLLFTRVGGPARRFDRSRRLSFRVRSTRSSLLSVRAVLHRGPTAKGPVVGRGSLARIDPVDVMSVRLSRRLTRGVYTMVVTARDLNRRSLRSTGRLRLR